MTPPITGQLIDDLAAEVGSREVVADAVPRESAVVEDASVGAVVEADAVAVGVVIAATTAKVPLA